MIDTLWGLGLAVAAFAVIHMLPGVPGLRALLQRALGANGYRGAFSLLAAGSLAWVVLAHRGAPFIELWASPGGLRLVPLAVMPFIVVLLTLGYASRPAVFAITRHPMLWSVALWGLAHIPANGEAASLILFGGFALFALIDILLIDARTRREEPERWAELQRTTSALPFAAIAAGRARLSMVALGPHKLAIALGVYVALVFLHAPVIGLSALP